MNPPQTHLAQMTGLFGEFPFEFIRKGTKSKRYFDDKGQRYPSYCFSHKFTILLRPSLTGCGMLRGDSWGSIVKSRAFTSGSSRSCQLLVPDASHWPDKATVGWPTSRACLAQECQLDFSHAPYTSYGLAFDHCRSAQRVARKAWIKSTGTTSALAGASRWLQ